jgi:hypothetical protein
MSEVVRSEAVRSEAVRSEAVRSEATSGRCVFSIVAQIQPLLQASN